MAYTTFQKEFWSDDYVLKLNEIQKLVYLYIITNEKTTQCGIYELPILKATTELSLSAEEFLIHLKKFSDDKKIQYSLETQEICVINWIKHNENTSWKTMERVKKELMKVKNPNLVVLLYDPREPLFDGFKRKKVGDKKYIEEPYKIDNPLKELFRGLSDEILEQIREPFKKYAPLMPLLCPSSDTSMVHSPNTYTNSKTNSESYTKTKAETVEESPSFQKYTGQSEKKPTKTIFSEITNYWNEKVPDQATPFTSLNMSLSSEVVALLEQTDIEVIKTAIEHYGQAYEHNKYKVAGFSNFMTMKNIESWYPESSVENRKPEEVKEKEDEPVYEKGSIKWN